MAWTRIDDGFRTNIKVRKAGPDGVLLYLYGLLHCNTNLTDGYIDDVFLPQIYADAFCRTPKVTVKKLVDCGLWIRMEGGYEVNDYLKYKYIGRSTGKYNPIRVKFKSIRKSAWKYLTESYEAKCAYCGSTENLEIDHIKPVAKGGTNNFENLQILCKQCNCRKSDRYEE